MAKFQIVSDSSCDLPEELASQCKVHIVPFYSTTNDKDYLKEGVELKIDDFYHTLQTQTVYPKTSLPTIQDYLDQFRALISAHNTDILCVCLTSKFSGSIQSAVNAKAQIEEEFPGRKVCVVDSKLCTFAQGLYVLEAAKLRDMGCSMEQAVEALDPIRSNTKIVFTVDSLDYLVRGGRIGKVSGFAGTLLNIKPIIYFYEGELHPFSKIRGRKKAIAEVVNCFLKDIDGRPDEYTVYVIHSAAMPEALELKELLEQKHQLVVSGMPYTVGVTIGTHIGPSVIGIVFSKKIKVPTV